MTVFRVFGVMPVASPLSELRPGVEVETVVLVIVSLEPSLRVAVTTSTLVVKEGVAELSDGAGIAPVAVREVGSVLCWLAGD